MRGRCLMARSNTARARPRLLPGIEQAIDLRSVAASTSRLRRSCGRRRRSGCRLLVKGYVVGLRIRHGQIITRAWWLVGAGGDRPPALSPYAKPNA
jgi:hypothetical protein